MKRLICSQKKKTKKFLRRINIKCEVPENIHNPLGGFLLCNPLPPLPYPTSLEILIFLPPNISFKAFAFAPPPWNVH